ncbi:MAG: hypothetical protein IPM93_25450 [Candidatus Obscuribacter sp.]|nr:hypothetical protein [Candidatus Obscuribacter sp.]
MPPPFEIDEKLKELDSGSRRSNRARQFAVDVIDGNQAYRHIEAGWRVSGGDPATSMRLSSLKVGAKARSLITFAVRSKGYIPPGSSALSCPEMPFCTNSLRRSLIKGLRLSPCQFFYV